MNERYCNSTECQEIVDFYVKFFSTTSPEYATWILGEKMKDLQSKLDCQAVCEPLQKGIDALTSRKYGN